MGDALSVRWDDLEAAFFVGSPDARYFLNTTTGDVEYTSGMDGEDVRARILRRTGGDAWIEIPRPPVSAGMDELRAFAESESDETLRADLLAALESEDGAPRAFNKALGTNREARARWAARRQAAVHARLLAFCTEHGLRIDDPRFEALAADG